jgi:hypothetical protein
MFAASNSKSKMLQLVIEIIGAQNLRQEAEFMERDVLKELVHKPPDPGRKTLVGCCTGDAASDLRLLRPLNRRNRDIASPDSSSS